MKAHCIYGPPGTGKTTELVRLINDVLQRNPDASVGFLSHTRVAAKEAVKRAVCKLPESHAMTLHSLCYQLVGVQKQQVITTERLQAFGKEVGVEITGRTVDSELELSEGDAMLAILSLARNRMADREQVYDESDRPGDLSRFNFFCKSYENWKASRGYVDFDDMLYLYTRRQPAHRYQVLFIDEFQDTSKLQHMVVDSLLETVHLAYVAGDDDQAIFIWAGAVPSGMVSFEARHHAKRKILDQSYRIPKRVHKLAQALIAQVPDRVDKEYKPRDEMGTLEFYGRLEHADYDKPCTVLYRDRAMRGAFEEYFIRELIPYRTQVGFRSPLDTRYGKAVAALDKLIRTGERPRMVGIEKVLTPLGVRAWEAAKTFPRCRWSNLVEIPERHRYYLDHVEIFEPRVSLCSIHSFKGAEDDHIILGTGMSGRSYANLSIDKPQEDRTFYVGVTRARHKLTIVEGDNSYPMPR